MPKIINPIDIQFEVESRRFKMLTPYVRANTPFLVQCDKGHKWYVKIGNFRRSVCPYCDKNYTNKYSYEYVKEQFAIRGLILLSNEYNNCKEKLEYICKCGKTSYITFDTFLSKNIKGCGNCKSKRMWDTRGRKFIKVRKYRTTKEYYEWRTFVLQRDNYSCQICNSKENLNVHHLDSFATYPEKRFNISNGITLCKYCHEHFHLVYSKFDNMKEEFLDFLSWRGELATHASKLK